VIVIALVVDHSSVMDLPGSVSSTLARKKFIKGSPALVTVVAAGSGAVASPFVVERGGGGAGSLKVVATGKYNVAVGNGAGSGSSVVTVGSGKIVVAGGLETDAMGSTVRSGESATGLMCGAGVECSSRGSQAIRSTVTNPIIRNRSGLFFIDP
jgi:hypothetical protein